MSHVRRNLCLAACLAVAAIVFMSREPRDPDAARREKVLGAYNGFTQSFNDSRHFWNAFSTAEGISDRRAQLQRCRDALQRIEPYQPIGVDPEFADAISDVKAAALARVTAAERDLDAWFPTGAEATAATERENAAHEKLESCLNRIAAEIGGIEVDRK